ncbi:MAG: HD domain-containing protein, partial [Spirochaetaceae bacterium]|nr:HD domain-containing protein [Spirochaetaceae bacterium]
MKKFSVNNVLLSVDNALYGGFCKPCRDALWGHVYLTPELDAITKTPQFGRLHRIAQLGPAGLVYPGATHTRAAHSIGVYHIARRLITGLCERGAGAFVSPCGIRSFLCAALLHDLGHFPYAHSLKDLFLTEHEQLGARLIEADPVAGLVARAGADPAVTAAILDTGRPTDDEEVLFYRKLLSGCLDPDKLDYLNRDARFAG